MYDFSGFKSNLLMSFFYKTERNTLPLHGNFSHQTHSFVWRVFTEPYAFKHFDQHFRLWMRVNVITLAHSTMFARTTWNKNNWTAHEFVGNKFLWKCLCVCFSSGNEVFRLYCGLIRPSVFICCRKHVLMYTLLTLNVSYK